MTDILMPTSPPVPARGHGVGAGPSKLVSETPMWLRSPVRRPRHEW